MGDYNVPDHSSSSSGSCKPKGSRYYNERKTLGTLLYKTDLNGYTARQFKTCVNNIEEVTLPSGRKKIFVLSDRGLFYLDNQDIPHRISIPLKNLPINITNIEDNYLIDENGSRYYLDNNSGIYNKSDVDNSSNTQANLNYYTSKALCREYYDERNNLTSMYVTSNGEYASWLFENYEGDRTWNAKVTDNGITFVFRDSIGNVFGIKNTGVLTSVDISNKTFNEIECKYVVDEEAEEIVTETITGIRFTSELTIGENTYLFLMTTDGVYYTPKINNTYDRNNFTLLNKVSVYNEEWITEDVTVPGTVTLAQNDNIIVFSNDSNIYCISKDLSLINDELSIIKNCDFTDSGVCKILIDDDDIYYVTQSHEVLNSYKDESEGSNPNFYFTTINGTSIPYEFSIIEFNDLSENLKKVVPNGWSLVSFHDGFSTNSNARFKFKIFAKIYKYITYSKHILTYTLHKLSVTGNLFSHQTLDITTQYSYITSKTEEIYSDNSDKKSVYVKLYEYDNNRKLIKETDYSLSDKKYYIEWSNGYVGLGISRGNCYGYIDQDTPCTTSYNGVTTTWPKVAYIGKIQSSTPVDIISTYQLYMYEKGKVISSKMLKELGYFKGFHDIKKFNDGTLIATPFGIIRLNSNLKISKDNTPCIDVTGDTDFREMYEINYNGGEYAGLWYVFTTSDGLLNCRAGDPEDPRWDGDWKIYKYGTSFWKIRCSTQPIKDPESKKKMVSFSNFNVKYPSYIY